MAMAASLAGFARLLVPAANVRADTVVKVVAVYGVGDLADAVGVFSGKLDAEPVSPGFHGTFAASVDVTDARNAPVFRFVG